MILIGGLKMNDFFETVLSIVLALFIVMVSLPKIYAENTPDSGANTRVSDVNGRTLPKLPHKQLPKRAVAKGFFKPNWKSLTKNYKYPEWFRDAKFGIWAHWSGQCQPEDGDWYARQMYIQGYAQYDDQLKNYGHPSEYGFKDIDNAWHAENWDPEKLIALYKAAGAKYFVALANHHDNFDCYDSTYQEWNSVRIGPHKDIVGTWEKAAHAAGLHFGVSNHSSRTWFWFQPAYGYDPEGPKAGIRYDGWMTRADGKGKWWEGLDPQELYGGPFIIPPDGIKTAREMREWYDKHFIDGNVPPPPNDSYYTDKWYLRARELVEKYRPDLFYLDDTELPLGQAGLDIAAEYYNSNQAYHGGRLEAVLTCKRLKPEHSLAVVADYERGVVTDIQPQPWQTDTCIGNWHYDGGVFKRHAYKSADQVVHMLCDIVSKNGNLLLSIPVKGDGTLDEDELMFLKGMTDWMAINQESIFGTRPWKVFGEGPIKARGGAISERVMHYKPADIRFTARGGILYAIVLALPQDGRVLVRSLASVEGKKQNVIQNVSLLGYDGKPDWKQDNDGLHVTIPDKHVSDYTLTLKIAGADLEPAPFREPPVPEHDWTVPKQDGNVYEAENAVLTGGASIATDHDNYSGKGFVAGYYSGMGQKTEFKVKAEGDGKRKATIRYSNSMSDAQTLSLYVNGKFAQKIEFQLTRDWETWATIDFEPDLSRGDNTVAFKKEKGDGCVNLDYLAVQ
jgi:alpha-L-fucosidase